MGDLTENWKFRHFSPEEFACKCCGENKIDPELVGLLEDIREATGMPLVILSGYRCPKHNAEVGGQKRSAHMRGKAADVGMPTGSKRYKFLSDALKRFRRVGIYPGFCHVDIDETLPQPVCWVN